MQLDQNEEQLLEIATQFLEDRHRDERIPSDARSDDLLDRLTGSDKEDLAIMGLYLLSRMPDTDPRPLCDNETSAKNVAAFVLGEMGVDEGRRYVGGMTARVGLLPQAFDQLAAELPAVRSPAAPPAAGEAASTMTILVHGTWARQAGWWRKGGDLWNHVNALTGDVYGEDDAFSWSGANQHQKRVEAAAELVAWARAHPVDHLDVIAHSHGCNVCFQATRLGLEIRRLIALAAPIRLEYPPDLRRIEILHNVFSTRDRIQTPAGTIPNRRSEGRTLGDGPAVINNRATDAGDGGQPGHSDLRRSATWTASGLDQLLRD